MLDSPRLFYLEYQESDLIAVQSLNQVTLGRAHSTPSPRPILLDGSDVFLELPWGTRTALFVVVVERRSGIFIGYTSLRWEGEPQTNDKVRLVMAVKEQWWGRRLGTEISRWTVAHAFQCLGVRRVCMQAFENDARALRGCAKVGFIQEGMRRAELADANTADVVLLGMEEEDFQRALSIEDADEAEVDEKEQAQTRALRLELEAALAHNPEEYPEDSDNSEDSDQSEEAEEDPENAENQEVKNPEEAQHPEEMHDPEEAKNKGFNTDSEEYADVIEDGSDSDSFVFMVEPMGDMEDWAVVSLSSRGGSVGGLTKSMDF